MIHKSTIEDVRAIHKLLQIYGDQGELLPRPLSKIYDHVRDFWVFQEPERGKMVGCCALQFHWDDLAEIRSLAVHPDHVNQKIGTALTQTAIEDARAFGIPKVFTLTYRPGFFEQFGFRCIDRADLPLKIWADCITCVKFPDCDEIAMIKEMDELTD
ncbi:MAG: N-acetyltransferase [Desulfobacterales bacterium]|nr:N-acetyltransferase [Desulfobacterales bacterium]